MNLCTGKAWRSSGNCIRTELLENSDMDKKISCSSPGFLWVNGTSLLWIKMPCGGTRDETTKVTIYVFINNLSILLLVLQGPIQALPFLKMSENTSQLMNSELSDKFDLFHL